MKVNGWSGTLRCRRRRQQSATAAVNQTLVLGDPKNIQRSVRENESGFASGSFFPSSVGKDERETQQSAPASLNAHSSSFSMLCINICFLLEVFAVSAVRQEVLIPVNGAIVPPRRPPLPPPLPSSLWSSLLRASSSLFLHAPLYLDSPSSSAACGAR